VATSTPTPAEPSTTTPSAPAETESDTNDYSDAEIERVALEITWDEMSVSDQESVCEFYSYAPTTAVNIVIDASGGGLTRAGVENLLDSHCG